ncbi:MAG TPA: hypothetical protein VMH22_06710 [bacterium]|nr:hypothetical protein [bacterium]
MLKEQVDAAFSGGQIGRYEVVAFYPCSLWDLAEVPREVRLYVYDRIRALDAAKYIILESRPEFITEEGLSELRACLPKQELVVFQGLETANDGVRGFCANKGYTFAEFSAKVQMLHDFRIMAGAQLMLKLPFLTEAEGVADAVNSIRTCSKLGIDAMVLQGTVVCEHTVTKLLHLKGRFRPPWLWSIVEVLKRVEEVHRNKVVVEGFTLDSLNIEYAHNCEKCSPRVMADLALFNRTRDLGLFDLTRCSCMDDWRRAIDGPSMPLMSRLRDDYASVVSMLAES